MAMKILAHRGCWGPDVKSNSPQALRAALELGFGIESDVRDYCGKLVISHNIADASCQLAEEVFQWLAQCRGECCFAINIKADGLKDLLVQGLKRCRAKNYFTFDMSVPQMVEFRQAGLAYFTRQSEVEPVPAMYGDAAGVWIDSFWDDGWISEKLLSEHIGQGKMACLVSPDLHGRPYLEFWDRLLHYGIDFSKVLLCTDHPREARDFFHMK